MVPGKGGGGGEEGAGHVRLVFDASGRLWFLQSETNIIYTT